MTRHLAFFLALVSMAATMAAAGLLEPIDDRVPAAPAGITTPAAEAVVIAPALEEPAVWASIGPSSCGFGSCNTNLDCFRQFYYCPSGTIKTCFDSTGSNCEGTCGCG